LISSLCSSRISRIFLKPFRSSLISQIYLRGRKIICVLRWSQVWMVNNCVAALVGLIEHRQRIILFIILIHCLVKVLRFVSFGGCKTYQWASIHILICIIININGFIVSLLNVIKIGRSSINWSVSEVILQFFKYFLLSFLYSLSIKGRMPVYQWLLVIMLAIKEFFFKIAVMKRYTFVFGPCLLLLELIFSFAFT